MSLLVSARALGLFMVGASGMLGHGWTKLVNLIWRETLECLPLPGKYLAYCLWEQETQILTLIQILYSLRTISRQSDQDSFLLISLIILISCLLDEVYILLGEVTFESLLGVKG